MKLISRTHLAVGAALALLGATPAFAFQDAAPAAAASALEGAAAQESAPEATASTGSAQDAPAEVDVDELLNQVLEASRAAAAKIDVEPMVVSAAAINRALAAVGAEPTATEALTIDPQSLRRELVYQAGRANLEAHKIDIYIEEEIARQSQALRETLASEGAEPPVIEERLAELQAGFSADEQELRKSVGETIKQIRDQYPSLPWDAVLKYNNIEPLHLLRMTRQSKRFENVFLPENPEDWPATTREALKSNEQGSMFYDQLVQAYKNRKAQEAAAAQPGPQPAESAPPAAANQGEQMFKMLVRRMITGALEEASDVRTGVDGLAPEVAMQVNGQDILTADVFTEIAPTVDAQELEHAQKWLMKVELAAEVMDQMGYWMSDEEFATAYAEEDAKYSPPFTLEVIARNFKGFPSMEAYRTYFRLKESYRQMIADEFSDEALTRHVERRAGPLIGLATVQPEIILISAFDFEKNEWKENGWEDAYRRAAEVNQRLVDSGGADWSQLLETYSDFWDPPKPTTPQPNQPQGDRKNKGRFPALNRNRLLQYLDEDDYTLFLDGYSIGDQIFFGLEEGQIDGPYKGRLGYYFARIVRKTPAPSNKSLGDEDFRTMVESDYLSVRLNQFVQQVFEAASEG
jgi:hypothetical protein